MYFETINTLLVCNWVCQLCAFTSQHTSLHIHEIINIPIFSVVQLLGHQEKEPLFGTICLQDTLRKKKSYSVSKQERNVIAIYVLAHCFREQGNQALVLLPALWNSPSPSDSLKAAGHKKVTNTNCVIFYKSMSWRTTLTER